MGPFIMRRKRRREGEKMAGMVPKGMVAQSVGRTKDDHLPLYLQKKILKKIMRWATEHHNFCAILYGAYEQKEGVIISGACRVKKAQKKMGHLIFTGRTWRDIKEQKKDHYPRLDLVGICVVQKGKGCEIPPDIVTIAQGHFHEEWQTILVVDSSNWKCCFYQWNGMGLKPAGGYYLLKKQEEEKTSSDPVQRPRPVSLQKESSGLAPETQEKEDATSPEAATSRLDDRKQLPSIPKELVDEIRSYGRRVRFLTALVTVMFVALVGTGAFLGIRQSTMSQPVWAQQAQLEGRIAQLEDKSQKDGAVDDQMSRLKQQLSDLEGKTKEQSGLIDELFRQVEELEQQLAQPSSEAQTLLPDHHVVQPGETLTSISIQYFGTPDKAYYLAAINGIQDPNVVRAGMVLRLSE